ncbi:MAG: hypothetical protein V4568_19000 [Pseudomonadota bacterium]
MQKNVPPAEGKMRNVSLGRPTIFARKASCSRQTVYLGNSDTQTSFPVDLIVPTELVSPFNHGRQGMVIA